jgi:hypothetical protein
MFQIFKNRINNKLKFNNIQDSEAFDWIDLVENYNIRKHYNFYLDLKNKISNSDKKIIIGPFYSEVGYEILYWFPFISWLTQYSIKENLYFIGRGGLSRQFFPNSNHICLIEKFNTKFVNSLIIDNSDNFNGSLKQKKSTANDLEIIKNLGFSIDDLIVYPSFLFRAYKRYYGGSYGVKFLRLFDNIEFYENIKRDDTKNSNIVVFKLYQSSSFNILKNKTNIYRLFEKLLDLSFEIQILTTNKLDDHDQLQIDLKFYPGIKVIYVSDENNLDCQLNYIKKSKYFISTYGGASYLGPLMGVHTIALADKPYEWYDSPHFQKFVNILNNLNNNSTFKIANISHLIDSVL